MTIFVSHSSKNDDLASDLESFLKASGFSDVFVDHTSIRTGESWADALRASAGSCRVVVCLVTEDWLASAECVGEFRAAWYMGKRIAPLFLLSEGVKLPTASAEGLARVRAESQGLDLSAALNREGRLDFSLDEVIADQLRNSMRAAGASSAIGLDPDAFEIDRDKREAPFPGLSAFGDEDADAAIFFGRSREIAETLEELRAMRASSDNRVLMILGASGAGKSSLLKAGIIPRLRREAPAWIPLRAFRPGSDPLLSFADALSKTNEDFGSSQAPGSIRKRLVEAWQQGETSEALNRELESLRRTTNRPDATILIGIDQAEELVRFGGESADILADYLAAATEYDANCRLAFTLRTDSFPELQAHSRFERLEARGYDLRSLPTYKFDDVVSRPAKRYGVDIDDALVDQLMEDAPGKDALPLLAFATQRLWSQFSAQGKLQLEDYREMGGLAGIIEDAAERALCGIEPDQQDVAIPPEGPPKSKELIAAQTFVPPLADVNEEGAAVRRVAKWSDFDDEQQALLARFDRWRLIVRKGDDGHVEVAHEALFREWPRLAAWLEPERARLEALRGLHIASRAWARNHKSRSFTTHTGQRLSSVRQLLGIERYRDQISSEDAGYIEACRVSSRLRLLVIAGAILAVPLSIGIGVLALNIYKSVRSELLQSQAEPKYVDYVKSSGELNQLADGAVFQDCEVGTARCPEMVLIPSGRFIMGSPESDFDAKPDELVQRDIAVDRFAVSKFEITWDEWQTCLDAGGCDYHTPDDSGFGREKKPIINVTKEEAQSYADWLSRMTGQDYRLLTEAEWEYAARGVRTADAPTVAYPWGDEPPICEPGSARGANYSRCGHSRTLDVGSFGPNDFGLYDMSGNVWEWVEDCYVSNYDVANPTTDAATQDLYSCENGVLRSGAWIDSRQDLRNAYRLEYDPNRRLNVFGFRVARTL